MSWTSSEKRYVSSTAYYEMVDRVKKKLFMACKETETVEKGNEILTADCAKTVIGCRNGNGHAPNYQEEGEQTFTEKHTITSVKKYIVCPGSSELELESSIILINSNASDASDVVKQKTSRKRIRCPENWQRIARKKKREAGEEYVNIKGKKCPAKQVHAGCDEKCAYNCSAKFTEQEREDLKKAFYSLNDAQKNKYYNEFTCRVCSQRKRTEAEESRRKFSYQYFFLKNEQKVKVCQKFFCDTLDISAKRIYYFYKKLHNNPLKLIPTPSKGKHIKKQTAENKIEEVIQHIKSFPTQESHFCRANTKRQYLEKSLSIAKMYSFYVESTKEPVKENIYRKVFNEKFNLAFHHPKKDACDACSEFKAIKIPNAEQTIKHCEHIRRKEEGNREREKDRKINETTAVVTFDLENIFSLPKANMSCFYYTSKLTVYNLTAHCNLNKSATNAMWDETKNGRSGDDLASALVKILKSVVDSLPITVTKLILWSDSCVPQNRNSHMSVAIIKFLQSPEAKQVTEITQKFSEPGHGNVQEVDAVHSLIERNLRHQEIFSPLSLMRAVLKIKSKALTFKFLQMVDDDFHCYHEEAVKYGFNQIPFSKVKTITYNKSKWNILQYKTSFQGPTTSVDINKKKVHILSDVTVKAPTSTLTQKKIQDIRSSYKYMPDEDKTYMETIILKALKKPLAQERQRKERKPENTVKAGKTGKGGNTSKLRNTGRVGKIGREENKGKAGKIEKKGTTKKSEITGKVETL
ncbi:unnamed protein product [Parnassius mnemosyne]|uniref:Uncharacterized protein n=1 Tax=Parnassius mnemosyne TaxID=213953 RepID=A0AAV1KX57_9NEOP